MVVKSELEVGEKSTIETWKIRRTPSGFPGEAYGV